MILIHKEKFMLLLFLKANMLIWMIFPAKASEKEITGLIKGISTGS